jgi:hypothetical protein
MNLPFLISRGGRLRAHFPSVRDSHPLRPGWLAGLLGALTTVRAQTPLFSDHINTISYQIRGGNRSFFPSC